MITHKHYLKKNTVFRQFLSLFLSFVILFDYSIFPSIALGKEQSLLRVKQTAKVNPSAEDLDKMMRKLLDPSLPNAEKKRITGILFYYQPIYRNAVSLGKFSANSPHVKAFLEQKKIMQADIIQRMGINYKNKYGHAPKQPVIPFDYNDIFSDDDIITGTGDVGRKLEPLYNEALNEVMQDSVGRPMDAATRKRVDVNGLAWNMTQDAAHLDFAHDEKYINPQSGYANQRKLIEGAKKGKVTVYTFDDDGRMIKLSPAESVEEIKRLAVGKTLDIPGIDATRGSGSMSDFLRMAEKHQIRPKGKVTVEQVQQFVRNQKYSQRVIGDYVDILEGDAKLTQQYGDFIDLSNKLRSAKTIKDVASLLENSYGSKILLPGGGVDYDALTETMLKHQSKQLSLVLPEMVAEVTSTEAYKIAKYLKTAGKGTRLVLRKQMALTYAPMTDEAIEKITKRVNKMPDIDAVDKKFINSIIKDDSRQIRRYAELLQIPPDELVSHLKINGDNIACVEWISSTARYKPVIGAIEAHHGGSRFAAFLKSKTAKALNLDTMLSSEAKASSKFMLFSMMVLAATRAYNASGRGEKGIKAVAEVMFEMIPFVSSVLRFSEGEGKQAFKEFCMDVLPPLALANLAVMLGNYVAEEVKTGFTEDVKDGIARQVLRDLNDDDFIESDVPCYYVLKDREGMLQYLDEVSPGLGKVAKLASMIEPEIDALMSRNPEVEINNKAISTLQWFETISVGPYEAKFGKMFNLEQLKARVYETGVPAINELPPVQRVAAKLIVDNLRIRKELYYEVIKNFMDRIERLYNEGKEDCGEEWVQIIDQTMKTIKSMYENAPQNIIDSAFGFDELKDEYRSIVEYLTAYDGEDKDLLELRKEMQEIIDRFREFIRKLGIVVDIQREGRYLDLQGHVFGGDRGFEEGGTIMLGDSFRIGISARVSPIRKKLPWTVYYYAYNVETEQIDKIASVALKPSRFDPGNEGLWLIENPEKTTFFEFDKRASKKYFPDERSYQIYPVLAFGNWSNPLAQVGYAALTNPADYPDLFSEDRAAFIGSPIEISMVRPTIYAQAQKYVNKGEEGELKIALHVPLYARSDDHEVSITSSSYVDGSNAPKVSPDSHNPVSTDNQVPPKNPSISSVSFDNYAEEGSYGLTIKAKIKGLGDEDQPLPQTLIINYIDEKEDNEKDKDHGDAGLASLVARSANLSSEAAMSCKKSEAMLREVHNKLDVVRTELTELENKVKKYDGVSAMYEQMMIDIDKAHSSIESMTVDLENISTEFNRLSIGVCNNVERLKKVDTNAQRDVLCNEIFDNEPKAHEFYQKAKDIYHELKGKKKSSEDKLKEIEDTKRGLDNIKDLDNLIETVGDCSSTLGIVGDELSVAQQKIESLSELKKEAKLLAKRLKQSLKSIKKTGKGRKAVEEIKASLSQIDAYYSSVKKCPNLHNREKIKIANIIRNYDKRLVILKKKLQKLYDVFGKPGTEGDKFASAKENLSLIDLLNNLASKKYVPQIAKASIDADACFEVAYSLKDKPVSYVLPNYKGQPISSAAGHLESIGISVSPVEAEGAPNPNLEYTVKKQTPVAGTEVKIVDANVTLEYFGKLDIEAFLNSINCEQYVKGSHPVYNETLRKAQCACDPLVMNTSNNSCIDCRTEDFAFQGALTNGNLNLAQAIVNEASRCVEWVGDAQLTLDEINRMSKCRELESQMYSMANQVPQINMVQVDALYNQAEQLNCGLSQATVNALNAAADRQRQEDIRWQQQQEEQRRQEAIRRQQQQQAIMGMLGSIMGNVSDMGNKNTFPQQDHAGEQSSTQMVGRRCSGTLSASPIAGKVGTPFTITVYIAYPGAQYVSRVTSDNPACHNCDLSKEGPNTWNRTLHFTGRSEPFTLRFMAYDSQGQEMCSGSISLKVLP